MHQHVNEPLNQLLQSFQGPFRLIQKRNDKCLDYDRAKNKAAKAKDVKDRDRIKQVSFVNNFLRLWLFQILKQIGPLTL